MFKLFQHVFPRARAWRTTADKPLTRFVKGLGEAAQDVRKVFDDTFDDVNPQKTRNLDEYEDQFGLPDTGLSDQERRDRLDAAWKAQGGQDPEYIQETLRANGFDVYVHEWWVPGTEPVVGVPSCATARNPFEYLSDGTNGDSGLMQDGATVAQDGESTAQDGLSDAPPGYPLVNKIRESAQVIAGDGSALMQDGPTEAQDGATAATFSEKEYILCTDPGTYPFYFYIGGENFPDTANVQQRRRNELEALCLKISPTHLWIGMMVEYN